MEIEQNPPRVRKTPFKELFDGEIFRKDGKVLMKTPTMYDCIGTKLNCIDPDNGKPCGYVDKNEIVIAAKSATMSVEW